MTTVRITCEAGHDQTIKFGDEMSREWVESWCGLIDGTHPLFIHSPVGMDSVIGKCCWLVSYDVWDGNDGICGKQIKAEIIDEGKP